MQIAQRWLRALKTASEEEMAERLSPSAVRSEFHAECDVVLRAHPNFLLEGTPSDTDAMLVAMKPHLREPLCEFTPNAGARVPQPDEGTLILLEAARLDAKQQTELLRWLDPLEGRPQVQVVSTTSEPLFSLVGSGAFLAELYYRLNVVRIDLTRSAEPTT